IAARALPDSVGWVALGIGAVGLAAWIAFLRWLPNHQPRESVVDGVEPIDSEVSGYIVSILLPLVAAANPSTGDLVAYGLCAILVLLVAYVSDLAVANPLIYVVGFRPARATVDGERTVVLLNRGSDLSDSVTVRRAVGVTYVTGS